MSQLEKLPDGEVVTQADGRTKSGRALRLSKFAALDGVLFRVTEASDPKEGYDSARCYVPVALRKQVIRRPCTARHSELIVMRRPRTRSWSYATIGLEWTSTSTSLCGIVFTVNWQRALTLVLYKGNIFLEPRIFEVRLSEILKNSVFQVIS